MDSDISSLRQYVSKLPVIMPARSYGETSVWLDGTLISNIKDRSRQIMLSVKLSWSEDKCDVPTEKITCCETAFPSGRIKGRQTVTREYSFPFGTLLNLAYEETLTRLEQPIYFKTGDYDTLGFLRNVINKCIKEETHTSNPHLLDPFADWSYTPISINSDKKPFDYYAPSLTDILYQTLRSGRDLFGKGAYIHRCGCRNCQQIFFSKAVNREYCYFINPDPIAKGKCCRIALKERRQYEKRRASGLKKKDPDNYKTNEELLNTLRSRYGRFHKCIKAIDYIDFSDLYFQCNKALKGDLHRYDKLNHALRKIYDNDSLEALEGLLVNAKS